MDGSPTTNSYLSGNFAPVRSEDDYDLEVAGEIPSGLRGAFYRNGPNPQFEPRGHYHWFTGDGMIHPSS
jgi:carotenoid cleavage dioxygenase-like enzyme